MSRFMDNVAIINSAIRTLLTVGIVGVLGAAGWYGYQSVNSKDSEMKRVAEDLATARMELDGARQKMRDQEQAISALEQDVAAKAREIERLDTAMRLLKVDHRVARLTVLDQANDPAEEKLITKLQFQELDLNGQPIDTPKEFTIPGDVIYVDSWVVKFDDKYVEEQDLHRSTSLVLFRRAFGEYQKPLDGVALDQTGDRPKVYGRSGPMTDFEKQIWSDFWSVAGDEQKQAELGIRAAHGEAPSIRVQKGKSYRVDLRASGGLTITPEAETKPAEPAA